MKLKSIKTPFAGSEIKTLVRSVCMTSDELKALDQFAKKTGKTRSYHCRQAIKDYLRRHGNDVPRKE
jgi:predicted DNA-binding protein